MPSLAPRRPRARAALAAVLLAAVVRPAASAPTLATITVDGAFADWGPVLADPDNVVLDGPAGGLPDADGPSVPASRDVDTIAFTWDATFLYLYIHRRATAPEFNHFWLALDLDNDGLVPAGAPLVSVAWWGNNRRVDVTLDRYQAVAGGAGDAIVSAGGSHDGYELPGTRIPGQLQGTFTGGSPDGLTAEARISWAALGVAPGTAIQFHLSSTRRANEYPAGINDNAGGGTGYAGVLLDPDRSLTSPPGGPPLVIPHTAASTGNLADVLDLTWSSTGLFAPLSVAFHLDADGSGTLTPGDTPLADTDGDGLPDTGTLAPFAPAVPLLAVVALPTGATLGQTATVTLGARSSARPAVADSAVDVITIAQPSLTLLKSVDQPSVPPGGVLTYSVAYANTGSADALAVEVVDAVPPGTAYVAGSAAGTGMAISWSHDGGATFDASEAAPVTHVKWSRAAALPPDASGTVSFQVTVN
ncbi:MAG TPA: DUF11 domain-containing protein [Candidatus Polarisedimenticolia bacterium]|nr:DUF11 domain-containing protein [Candidatus Polarisedimenticolia bacterium]